MATNTLPGSALTLGGFLRDRRARLPPGPGAQSRRRTPGLRREEVATRAGACSEAAALAAELQVRETSGNLVMRTSIWPPGGA